MANDFLNNSYLWHKDKGIVKGIQIGIPLNKSIIAALKAQIVKGIQIGIPLNMQGIKMKDG